MVEIIVRDNNIEQAVRILKRKLQREGVLRELKERKTYEKPSEKRVRKAQESYRRTRKLRKKFND